MVVQARAVASRQAILTTAAEVFSEFGLFTTSLADVIERAGVTKGKFIYHFPSRESLAVALIAEADAAVADTIEHNLDSTPCSALEGLIRASFAVAERTATDPLVRVGVALRHGMGQIGTARAEGMIAQRAVCVAAIAHAVAQGDLRADIDPERVARALVTAMVGNHLQSAATEEDLFAGLAIAWEFLLSGIATEQSADCLERVVNRLADHGWQKQ